MKYSPKPDLWSKIQQRKDFDSQVKEHVENLPERMPKMDLWNTIDSEIDRKTPVIPLWKYGMVAASIGLILVLSGISYLEFGEKDVETQMVTDARVYSQEPLETTTNMVNESEPDLQTPEQIEIEKTQLNISVEKEKKRKTTTPIDVPNVEMPNINPSGLRFEKRLVSQLDLPAPPEQEVKTLHKVRISWGLEDEPKFRTTLGQGAPEDVSKRQLGRADQVPSSIKIKINRQ